MRTFGHLPVCLALLLAAVGLFLPEIAGAEGCSGPKPLPDGNTVVSCLHVTIEIEKGATFHLSGRNAKGSPSDATLGSGAVYVSDHWGASRGSFQIRTPDAIASVRGTQWAVDVTAVRSSVFVVAGGVAVRRRQGGPSVSLSAGEGVDVGVDDAPLVVKRWPPARAAALLARFGR